MKAICIGETVLEIIFRDNKPIAAMPGGSMLNSAVSLGRAGAEVTLVSEFSADPAGDLVLDFLKHNHVSTVYMRRHFGGETPLSLAFLDERHNAGYSFYKAPPEEKLPLRFPETGAGDMVLFGSYFALSSRRHEEIVSFIGRAKASGAFILYDPNFRRPHLAELDSLKPLIIGNMGLACLVRGSDEDFHLMFGCKDGREAWAQVQASGCPALIYTRNSKGVELFTAGIHLDLKVPPVVPVSTIGAGDAFNAGIIHALMTREKPGWETILERGIRFAGNSCLNLENYITAGFGESLNLTPPLL